LKIDYDNYGDRFDVTKQANNNDDEDYDEMGLYNDSNFSSSKFKKSGNKLKNGYEVVV